MENYENEKNISSYFAYLNKRRENPTPEPFKYQPVKQSDKIKQQIKNIIGSNFNSADLVATLQTLSFEEKEILLGLLLELFHLTEDQNLLPLIDAVKNSLDEQIEKEKKNENKKQADENDKDQKARQQEIDRKNKNYSDYAFEKAKDKNFSATTKPTVDTKEYDNLSRYQLVSMFRPHIFYSLSASQRHKLCQAVVNDYCRANGISPCAVNLSPLPCGNGYMTFGEYAPCKGTITLNSRLFDLIDDFSEENNTALPYKILQTLVHETEHRVQFMNIDKNPKNEADAMLKLSLLEPQSGKSYADYLAEPDEIGARNAALAYIRDCATECERPEESALLSSFYNCQKEAEIKSPKSDTSQIIKDAHPDIYNGAFIHAPSTIQASMKTNIKDMMGIALGRTSSFGRSLGR